MTRAHRRSLALAACLCGAGPVVADESGGPWRNPPPALETATQPGLQPVSRVEMDLLRFFGGEALEWGNNRFTVPLKQETWRLDSSRSLLVNALAIEWRHSMNAANQLTLSARYDDNLYSDPAAMDGRSAGREAVSERSLIHWTNAGAVFRPGLPGASGTAATLSWSTLFSGESRVSGRLYVGDEEAKLAAYGEHRYFGMQLEGRYGLWRDHTPFASLLWQRNNYESLDSGLSGPLLRHESFSRFAAGWNWQLSPSWDMRAEANYRLADENVEAGEFDRTQLYFSTRYGFR